MAINRFDSPAQAQFINTHVPIPFQELAQAAAMRQGRADQNLARLDAAQVAASNLEYIPNSQDQLTVEGWQRGLSSLADEYINQDLSDPEIARKLTSSVRQMVNPNQVKAIQQSAAGYKQYQKTAAHMQARGERVYQPFDPSGYDTLGDRGIFTQNPMMDLGEHAEQAIDKFMTKPGLNKVDEVMLPSGMTSMVQHRDPKEIEQLVNSELGELLNNPAIQQLMEREGLDEEGFKQNLIARIPSYLEGRYSSPYKLGGGEQASGPKNQRRLTHQMQGSKGLSPNDFLEIGDNMKFDDDGNIARNTDSNEWIRATGIPAQSAATAADLSGPRSEASKDAALERNKAKIAQIQGEFEQLKGLSDKETFEAYQSITKDMGSYRMSKADISLEQSAAWKERFALDILDRDASVMDERKGEVVGSLNDPKGPLDKLGYSPAEFSSALRDTSKDSPVTVAGVSLGDGHTPGTIILQVADKKGKGKGINKKLHVSTNEEFTGAMTPLWMIHQNMISGGEDLIPIGFDENNNMIGVSTSASTKKVGKEWRYKPDLQIGFIEGNPEQGIGFIGETRPIGFSDVSKYIMDQVLTSGFIGSDLHNLGSSSNVQ